jgi:hypothetical protein
MNKDWMFLDFDKNSNIKSIPESNILLDDLELGDKQPIPSRSKKNYKIPIFLSVSFLIYYIYFYY